MKPITLSSKTRETLVFVYGSLKRGYYNYYGRLDGTIGMSKYLHDASTKGIMYDLGSFPAVDISGNGVIHGEVFQVDGGVLRVLDRLEGYPQFYDRTMVKMSTGEIAYIYHIPKEKIPIAEIVKDGNWTKK